MSVELHQNIDKYGISILPQDIYSIFIVIIVFLLGLALPFIFSYKLKINLLNSIILYFWHTSASITYIAYIRFQKGDSIQYFLRSLDEFYLFAYPVGSKFVITFTHIFSAFLSFPYLAVFLIFNIIGYSGLILLWDVFNKNRINQSFIISIFIITIIFLPSMSFWSSSIGKDSISFYCTCLLIWSIYSSTNRVRNLFLKYFSLIILFAARPQIGAVGLCIFVFADLLIKKSSPSIYFFKIILFILLVFTTPILFIYILEYVGYFTTTTHTTFHLDGLLNFLEIRTRY